MRFIELHEHDEHGEDECTEAPLLVNLDLVHTIRPVRGLDHPHTIISFADPEDAHGDGGDFIIVNESYALVKSLLLAEVPVLNAD